MSAISFFSVFCICMRSRSSCLIVRSTLRFCSRTMSVGVRQCQTGIDDKLHMQEMHMQEMHCAAKPDEPLSVFLDPNILSLYWCWGGEEAATMWQTKPQFNNSRDESCVFDGS